MQKKMIEKIEWMTKLDAKGNKIFVEAAVHTLKDQEHLIVDIGSSKKTIRVVLTEDNYATLRYENKIGEPEGWCTSRIENVLQRNCKKEVITEETRTMIYDFTNKKRSIWGGTWFAMIENYQSMLQNQKRNEAWNRKHERIQKMMKEIPKPTKAFFAWAIKQTDQSFFIRETFGDKGMAKGSCTSCGGDSVVNKSEGKRGGKYICPSCKKELLIKLAPKNSKTRKYEFEKEVSYLQKTELGIIEHHFVTWKKITNGKEESGVDEKGRKIFLIEQGSYLVYFLKRDFVGNEFWDDKNIGGMGNIVLRRGPIYGKNLKQVIEDTRYKYSCLDKMITENISPIEYLNKFDDIPELEMLVKMGCKRLAAELSIYLIDDKKTKPWERLGLTKEQMNRLAKAKGGVNCLLYLKNEKRFTPVSTLKEIDRWRMDRYCLKVIPPNMSLHKFFNHLKKTKSSIKQARTYIDYLRMAKELQYDLQNSIVLYPKDIDKNHNEAVERSNAKKTFEKVELANGKYKDIAKARRKYKKQFAMEDDELFIRPPVEAGEIIREGTYLHHCVGGDNYLSQMNDGRSVILFIRKKEDPETPFFTVEVKAGEISQCYGVNNTRPGEKVKPFIEQFKKLKLGG